MAKLTTPAPTRTARRKAATEAAIVAAGERLFNERGFRDTRVEDLAAAADVAVGSIYAHFGSKLGLFLEVVERALAAQEALLLEIHARALPADVKLRQLGEAFVAFALDNPSKFRLLSEGPRRPGRPDDEDLARRVEQMSARGEALIDAMAATIDEGVRDGTLRRVDPRHSARFLWAAWSGALALHLRHDRLGATDPLELEAIVQQGTDLVTYGLVAAAPTAR